MPVSILDARQQIAPFIHKAAEYLLRELSQNDHFIISAESASLYQAFQKYLKSKKANQKYSESVAELKDQPTEQFNLIRKWLQAYVDQEKRSEDREFINETAVLLMCGNFKETEIAQEKTQTLIKGLRAEHDTIKEGTYELDFNAFINKMDRYRLEQIPLFRNFTALKKKQTEAYRKELKLKEFQPRVLSSFVRNRLIDKVYLPLIGDNLAKQIGTTGESTRTDRMGLLLLISPPGYGKTTLMEYIASRLGLIFMKINGPAIGHRVYSLDPAEAPNRAAAQELQKLNLALEMGDNVVLYVDDIQHCHPEFLQKFISLCDAQRRIEGIWKGKSKTYDLRGKRFAVIMAGNPYTESGEQFKIPDMLANRADIYNLGDIIGDSANDFKLSYIENSLTSNHILARLAGKSLKDVYTLVSIAESGQKEGVSFEANHAPEELNEYLSVLKKLLVIRDTILAVNQEYIRSAATAEAYRTEPPFKLQGSYRNMNKIAEKVAAIMNEQELDTLIISHYESEAQTLTSGAESNFLKFKELTGRLKGKERDRWEEIRKTFNKNKLFNATDSKDPVDRVVGQLHRFSESLDNIKDAIEKGIKGK